MIRVVLPWVDRKLVPHAGGHWAVKAKATKSARDMAFWTAVAATPRRTVFPDGDIALTIKLFPTRRCRMDRTNMQAACKAYIDGVADAWKVNDKRFAVTWEHCTAPDFAGVIFLQGEAV